MKTDCNLKRLHFGRLGRREIVADFGGGQLSSDGGCLLLRQVEEKTDLIGGFARHAMRDYRDASRIEHTLPELLKQRVFGLALGYEDLCDHDELRRDPLLASAVGKNDPSGHSRGRRNLGRPLASSATLHRLETTAENPAHERYLRFDVDPEAADDYFLEHFVASMKRKQRAAPKELVIDLDPSDVELHGKQEGRFFHGYYGHYCYLPLFVYCGDYLLCVRLQTADRDPARHTVEVMKKIVNKLRSVWPKVRIVLRADSGFSREEIYAWCEAHSVDFVIGLARNPRLEAVIAEGLAEAKGLCQATGQAARLFSAFDYRTQETWSRQRRVIAKAEALPLGQNPRFVTTSLLDRDPRWIYEDLYCQRGEAENRIKEQQLYLFGDRLSAETMRANQNRLYFSALAYLLIRELRETGLRGTDMAQARADTIRLRLFKIAAQVRVTVRKVWVRLSSACPFAEVFQKAQASLIACPQLVM